MIIDISYWPYLNISTTKLFKKSEMTYIIYQQYHTDVVYTHDLVTHLEHKERSCGSLAEQLCKAWNVHHHSETNQPQQIKRMQNHKNINKISTVCLCLAYGELSKFKYFFASWKQIKYNKRTKKKPTELVNIILIMRFINIYITATCFSLHVCVT